MKTASVILTLTIFFLNISHHIFAKQLVIKGSDAMSLFIQKCADAYMKENPNVGILVFSTGSGRGIKSMIDGKTDMVMTSRFLKDKEIRMSVEKGNYPVPFLIAKDCIIPVIHKNNAINNLSLEQLRQIFQGEIVNWRQVGGKDLKIKIISRDRSSGSFDIFRSKVLKESDFAPSASLKDSDKDVVKAIPKDPGSIGYISIGFLNSEVKAISVSNVQGTPQNISNGSYPISRPLFIFTIGWPDGEVHDFLNFILEPAKGQRYIKSVLYEASPQNWLHSKPKS